MSRDSKSRQGTAGKVGVITVLGAAIGTAVGAAMGNMPLGVAVGAALGLIVGGALELVRRRQTRR